VLLAIFNTFIKGYRRVLRMAEISDANHFNLVAESRYVARIEFEGEEAIFWRDVVELAVAVADKIAAITLPGDIAERNRHLRMMMIGPSAKELRKAKTE
jgi:hypothetical protein